MIKGSILQDGITILNVYVPNRVPKYVGENPIELKGEIEKSTIIVEYFNTPISVNDRSASRKSVRI